MAEQKAFYELPKPTRKKYFVIVQEDTTPDDTPCTVSDCQTNKDADMYDLGEISVYECDCCGQWFCIDHIDKNGLCSGCTKLPKGLQQEIITFQEELNR